MSHLFMSNDNDAECGSRRLVCQIAITHLTLLFVVSTILFSPNSAVSKGIDYPANAITISLYVEPPNLDSSLSEDTTSATILRLVNEGLIRVGADGDIEPGVAESWELGEKEATFHLRKSARWQDGRPVTAPDFVFSWRRLVNPKTAASGSAFFAYVIKHASDILNGTLQPEHLGVTAIDDHTLHVQLSRPVPYLLSVLLSPAYFPLREDFVNAQGGRFGADAVNLLSNGPFVMDTWIHSASISLKKNPEYWNSEAVLLDGFEVGYITSDVRSLLNLYKSSELATLTLSEEILGDAMKAGLPIKRSSQNCLAWLFLNMKPGRITANKKVRQAIRYAFDRDAYVNIIVGLPGTRKIDSVFTRSIRGVKRSFQREYPAPTIEHNIAKGRRLIEEVKRELGGLPPIILLANETRQVEAEYIQGQLGSALGLEIKVDKQSFKQAIAKMNAHDFDMARAGFCSGALRDPIFYAGVFASTSAFNSSGFISPAYDKLLAITHGTADQTIRMNAFGKMQQLLYDEVPVIPTHQSSNVYLEDSRLRGFIRYPLADYSRGRIN